VLYLKILGFNRNVPDSNALAYFTKANITRKESFIGLFTIIYQLKF